MSYFNAQLGKRPAEQPEPATEAKPAAQEKEAPLFASRLGPCPTKPAGSAERPGAQGGAEAPAPYVSAGAPNSAPAPRPRVRQCPLCRGALAEEHGLYRCEGRCGARWVEESPGHLVDLAALPFGVCACCQRPQALVRSERGAACPLSGSEYLLLPEGPRLLADAARNGLCLCCAPPSPLVRREDALVCQARPANRYRREGGRTVLAPPAPQGLTSAEALAAIDAALRRNSASVTLNGLFDLD